MALKWFNIRSRETRTAETEPQIAAMYNSSDHSPNIAQGQDFGWRLAPEVVVELRRISRDPELLERIAGRFKKPVEELNEVDILHWISNKTTLEAAPVATEEDYSDEYAAEIRRLEGKGKSDAQHAGEESVTTTTTKSLEELRRELAEREAAEGVTTTTTQKPEPTTTTTTTEKPAPTTTTTTTEAPTTTTTTTQKEGK